MALAVLLTPPRTLGMHARGWGSMQSAPIAGRGVLGIHVTSVGMALAVLASVACATPAAAQSAAQSYFPSSGVAEFLVHSLDLSTLRSSLGPRRSISQRTFATLGIVPTRIGPDDVVMESDAWVYALRVLRRADINGDGLEDLEVCFTDRAKGGTYSARKSLLVTRYSASAYAVALNYEVFGCEDPSR